MDKSVFMRSPLVSPHGVVNSSCNVLEPHHKSRSEQDAAEVAALACYGMWAATCLLCALQVLKTNEDDLEDEGESESQPEIDYPSSSFKGQFITASDGEGLQWVPLKDAISLVLQRGCGMSPTDAVRLINRQVTKGLKTRCGRHSHVSSCCTVLRDAQ